MENSGAEIDQTVSSDDELNCKLMILQPLPIVESMSLERPAVPSLKKITNRKMMAGGKNVPIGNARKSYHTAPAGDACSFEKKKAIIASKKHPTIETVLKGDSAEFPKKSSVTKKKPAPKPKDPNEERSNVLAAAAAAATAADESRNKPKVVFKNSCKLVAMVVEEQPPVKKSRRDPKY